MQEMGRWHFHQAKDEKLREVDADPLVCQACPLLFAWSLQLIYFVKKLFSRQMLLVSRLFPLPLSGRNSTKKCYDPQLVDARFQLLDSRQLL